MTGDRGWSRLEKRDNALNAVRLALACAVIIGHSWEIGYGAQSPVPNLAGRAVDGFFVVSGFLIAASRDRLPLGQFLWRRAVRIFPGLWACLLVTAFAIAPLVAPADYDLRDAASYVWSNALLQMGQLGIGGGPDVQHVPMQWNGSLWTLAYEFGCYVGLALLFRLKAARMAGVVATLFASTILCLTAPAAMGIFPIEHAVRLAGFFAAGALLYLLRDRVRLSRTWGVASMAIVVLGVAALPNRTFWAVEPLPLAYMLLWAGASLPVRVGQRNDISYGMYVYAFPVQQSLVVLGAASAVTAPLFAALSMACTAPLAWASWRSVERPAMKLRLQHSEVLRHVHEASGTPVSIRGQLRPGIPGDVQFDDITSREPHRIGGDGARGPLAPGRVSWN